MTLEAEKKHQIHEIKAGVHLATISKIGRFVDDQKNQIMKDGEAGLIFTFMDGSGKKHEQVYWIGKGKEGRERFFTKMAIDAGVDVAKTPLSVKEAIGKRLWIAVREVFTLINGGEDVLKSEITKEDIVEYFIFDTAHVDDPLKPPTWEGDPAKHKGTACGLFVSYKYEGDSNYDGETISSQNTLKVEELKESNIRIGRVGELNSHGIAITPENETTYIQLCDEGKSHEEAINIIKEYTKKENPVVKIMNEVVNETIGPNFGDEKPAKSMGELLQPFEDKANIAAFKEAQEKAMPNFLDDESPDAKFN